MPKAKPAKQDLAPWMQIAHQMYQDCPVWRTSDYDKEMEKRWKASGKKWNEDDIGSGRSKSANMIDWTKAALTRIGHTQTLKINGVEFRIWRERAGYVEGKSLVLEIFHDRCLHALAEAI